MRRVIPRVITDAQTKSRTDLWASQLKKGCLIMLSLIIAVIGVACLATAAVCTALYVPAIRALGPAYRELLLSEGEAVDPARQKYWALDRRQQRLALWTCALYAVGCLSTLLLGDSRNAIHITAVIGLTLCIWVVSWFATFRKDTWQIRMEVEDLKHQKHMEEKRRGA